MFPRMSSGALAFEVVSLLALNEIPRKKDFIHPVFLCHFKCYRNPFALIEEWKTPLKKQLSIEAKIHRTEDPPYKKGHLKIKEMLSSF